MEKKWYVTGLLLLITGIILGAFGAHALKDMITDTEKLIAFETSVRYQLIHAVAFLAVPVLLSKFDLTGRWAFRLLLTGVLFFSGSIYLLVVKELAHADWLKFFGPVTPVGGLLLILGWIVLLTGVLKSGKTS